MPAPFNSVAILGCTASGKTAMACALAHTLGGGIISLDSRQVYRELNIGCGKDLNLYTAYKPEIPFKLINIASVNTKVVLQDWMRMLRVAFDEMQDNKVNIWFCGGSHLYLDALRKPFTWSQIPEDKSRRQILQGLTLQELLHQLDAFPEWITASVDRHSIKRVVRALEIAPVLVANAAFYNTASPLPYKPLYIGLYWPREQLIQRIEARLDARLEMGMLQEVEQLMHVHQVPASRLIELGLEYRYCAEHIMGYYNFEALKQKLNIAIRQYAKRQMTWFRHMEREGVKIQWFDARTNTCYLQIEAYIRSANLDKTNVACGDQS